MNADAIIVIVVMLFLLFGGALKRLLQRVAQQMEEDQASQPDYEASPEQVKEFLSSLETTQQPQVGADVQAAAARPQREPATRDLLWSLEKPAETGLAEVLEPPVQAPAGPQRTTVSPFWGGAETVAAAPRPREKPAAPRQPRRKRTEASRRIKVAEAGPVKPPREARKAAAITPLALRSLGLKEAVV
ncbi:MAG: hypothetical protein KAX44_09165, partial [Candidatus Brocadiae bacterium]|nr:hypothetical protein [Candidatus Brocadiia bacterium]